METWTYFSSKACVRDVSSELTLSLYLVLYVLLIVSCLNLIDKEGTSQC